MWEKQQFLITPQIFLPFLRTFPHFHQIQNCRLQTLSVWDRVNPVPNDKSLDVTKLKAFAYNKIKVAKMIIWISVFDRVENTVGKGENAGYGFSKIWPMKTLDCVVMA